MNRRWFLGASLAVVGSVFVPKYERWYRQGSGLLVPRAPELLKDPYIVLESSADGLTWTPVPRHLYTVHGLSVSIPHIPSHRTHWYQARVTR